MEELTKQLQEAFNKMSVTGKLFRVALTGQEIWEIYLSSFNNDPVFRDPSSSSHNCNHCKNFVRRYGDIIAIDADYNIMTIFDVEADEEYAPSMKALSKVIKRSEIVDIFVETFSELQSLPYESCKKTNTVFQLGIAKNHKQYSSEEAAKYGVVKAGEVRTFNHLHLSLPKQFVDMSGRSVQAIMSDYRSSREVFLRAMQTIPVDTLKLVRDLIRQGSLLNGEAHLHKIEQIIPLKEQYDKLESKKGANWSWVVSFNLPIAKFRNELIGVLCTELAEGEDLNKACQSWNKRVDPANYMKATAPITKRQIEEARKFVEENGYTESFDRRFATIDDINVSEILHANVGNDTIKTASIFDNVKSTSSRHKRAEFDKVEEVSIDKFMRDILPECTGVEAFLENKHQGNMTTLTTANNPSSKSIFKWSNNYSWTFNGNLAGKSQIKEAVKSHGGKVDGVLRFSIMWAEGNGDNSDLDAHCIESNGSTIYYGNSHSSATGGNLDVDIRTPQSYVAQGRDVVENITYPSLQRMRNGDYRFLVHQFSAHNSQGFRAEIEFDGQVFSYEYNRPVSGKISVADVSLKGGQFTIKHHLPESTSSKDVYGLETNQFHKVNLVCLSPNHWGSNNVGNKHYMFMLEGCKTPTSIRSFHNENLIPELLEHRKVMEVLGTTNMLEPTNKQLSGLGFNATVRDELIVKLSGNFKRVVKIKF